jgi:GDPmannose 4,6-dehydratase
MKKAFITGINGQDGSYLAEYLLSEGYEVHGIVRRNSVPENQSSRMSLLEAKFKNRCQTYYGDLLDSAGLFKILNSVKPDEVYNLAAQSHVRISYDIPSFTVQTNSLGVLNLLEVVRETCPDSKFYQASSSEMFGSSVDDDGFQRETTVMNPVSPYGCSKVFAYNIVRNYRKAYNMFAANGILFNHESPRRGSNFVTNKIIKTAVGIKLGLEKEIVLGNLDSYRDWGHSSDYVRAMHMIINHSHADDFVVATGETRSVRDMVELTFNLLGLNYQNFLKIDPKLFRPQELDYLRGDCTKLKSTFDWSPSYTFETMVEEMVEHWFNILKR